MSLESDNFISEVFWDTKREFAFQKVGRYYRLYDWDSGFSFLKEFTSFQAMQNFMNEARCKNAEVKQREL